jgi:hypothetical protein
MPPFWWLDEWANSNLSLNFALAKRVQIEYRPNLRGYMQALKSHATQRAGSFLLSALLVFPTFAFAQDPPPPPPAPSDAQAVPAPPPPAPAANMGGWKRVGDQTAQNQNTSDNAAQQPNGVPMQAPAPQGDVNGPNGQPNGYPTYGQPVYGGQQPGPQPSQQPGPPAYPQNQGGYTQGPPPQGYPQPNYQQQNAPPPVPATLTMPAGTYVTVRINQMLSSDKNQVGDAFSATITKPLVVNGVVVAEPGQTVGGHVVEAVKAGHVSGLARLGVQLTDLTLVDGQTLPIKSSLISRTGPSSVGQDAGVIAGTTALGAAVGAAAAWGKGAAIGAGSGLVLGTIGVLVTRGHPSVLLPEQMLTFRVEAPVTIATDHAPQAFHYIEPGEYGQAGYGPQGGGAYGPGPYTSAPYGAYPPVAAPAPYYYGYPYPYYAYGYPYYPYYWGPGFSLFLGGRYYGGYRGYYGGYGRYYGGPVGRAGVGVGGARVGGGVAAHSAGSGGRR